jgi:predicted AlkP superfamily pyrophosphatase or phosphodiesterase
MDEGSYFPSTNLGSSSFDSSAQATFHTGAYPAGHGIIAGRWHEGKLITADSGMLQATTLAEQVRAADARNRTFSMSGNRKLAAIATGTTRPAQARTFGATAEGGMEPYPGGDPEAWWRVLPRRGLPDAAHGFDWRAMYAAPGAPALRQLRFDAAHPEESVAEWQASPAGLGYQFDFLRELITREKLGKGAGIDLVTVTLDGFGLLARAEGGDSPLVRELLLNLDMELENLLTLLMMTDADAAVVLHGLHGTPDLPAERNRSLVNGVLLAEQIEKSLTDRFGAPTRRRVETFLYPFLYLRGKSDSLANGREMRLAAGRAALATGKVRAFYTADGDCSQTGEFGDRMRNSFHATRSGDVMFAYPPGFIEDTGDKRGVSFGSLYNYDTQVPVIFWGPQFNAQQSDDNIHAVDVAPTLARVLDIGIPSSSVGEVRALALARNSARIDKAPR